MHSTAREAARVAREAGVRAARPHAPLHPLRPGPVPARARRRRRSSTAVEVAHDGLVLEMPARRERWQHGMERATRDLARITPALLAAWRGLRRRTTTGGAPGGCAGGHGRPSAAPAVAIARPARTASRPTSCGGGGRRDAPLGRAHPRSGARRGPLHGRPAAARRLPALLLAHLLPPGARDLSELPRRPGAVLDLGSGPGPVAFAALDAGAAEVDRGRSLRDGARRGARDRRRARDSRSPRGRGIRRGAGALAAVAPGQTFDTIALGHVVNELFAGPEAATRRAALLEEAAALLRPAGRWW